MIALLTAWAYIKLSILPGIIDVLRRIPPKVWLVIGAIALVLYYGHWKEKQGYKACQTAVAIAKQKEKDRQQRIIDEVIRNSVAEALKAQERNELLERQVQNAMAEVEKWKAAGSVCLPDSVTRSLRGIGTNRSGR